MISCSSQGWAEGSGPVITGFVDSGFVLTARPNQALSMGWSLNEIEFQISHKWSQHVRARVAVNYLPSTTDQVDALWLMDQLLQEAWVELKTGFGGGWEGYAVAGRYFATMGWDAVNTVDRLQATGSFGQQITPNTFVGLKAGVRSSFFDVHLQVVNGWDTLAQPGDTLGFGGSVGLNFAFFRASLSYTSARGSGILPRFTAERLHLMDFHFTIPLWGERILLGAEFFLGLSEAVSPEDAMIYGAVACFHIMPVPWFGFTARYSRYSDRGFAIPTAELLREEISFALISSVTQGFRLITEYRLDLVNAQIASHLWMLKGIYSF
ncbi:MAG: hypothetical protein H6727_20675 [Myxococcales bacterium]|nr:hypothetical protein [Myxococcales bacterium]